MTGSIPMMGMHLTRMVALHGFNIAVAGLVFDRVVFPNGPRGYIARHKLAEYGHGECVLAGRLLEATRE